MFFVLVLENLEFMLYVINLVFCLMVFVGN